MHSVTLIKGDGIGSSIMAEAVKIIDASGARINWEEADAGMTAYDAVMYKGKVHSGENVLVAGGAGGVGSFAVPLIGYHNPAAIIATAGDEKSAEHSAMIIAEAAADPDEEDDGGDEDGDEGKTPVETPPKGPSADPSFSSFTPTRCTTPTCRRLASSGCSSIPTTPAASSRPTPI